MATGLALVGYLLVTGPVAQASDAQPLSELSGEWAGSNKLWFLRPNKPLLSEGTATVGPRVLSYSWAYKGAPQTGEMTVSGEDGSLTATWTDTWHSPQPMTLQQTDAEGVIAVLGSYSGLGRDWGWRIELGLTGDQLSMQMFNISPRGKERIAVELIADRQE